MEKEIKQKFIQLQYCMLLLVVVLLPEFSLLKAFGIDFDVLDLSCKLIGIIGGGLALYFFHQSAQKASTALPLPFLACAAGGMALALISLVPSMPWWLEYVALVALLIALFLSKSSLNIRWDNAGSQGAYLILLAILLHVSNSINDTIMTGLAGIVGLIFYLVGLGKLKAGLDTVGIQGASKLKIAIFIGIAGSILGMIPLIGIVGSILAMIAFVFEFMGYGDLKRSKSLGEQGQEGAGKLRNSMIVLLIAVIVGWIPGIGDTIQGFLCLFALWMVYQGWSLILIGLEEKSRKIEAEIGE